MARVLPFSRRKAKGPELVDVFMLHTTVGDDRPAIVARARLPIADARSQMGARGFYVNFLINWPFIMSCGIGVLFIVWEVALLMIGGITNPAAMLPYLIGSGAIGAGMGYALARIHRRRASGQCPEVARGCSCESGIMVLKQQSRPQNKEHPIDATTQPSRSHPNRV